MLKSIKEGQADFATKMDELKRAFNKDIDKKPEILESSSESARDSGPRSRRTDSRQVRIRFSNDLNRISELDEELYASPGNRLELFKKVSELAPRKQTSAGEVERLFASSRRTPRSAWNELPDKVEPSMSFMDKITSYFWHSPNP